MYAHSTVYSKCTRRPEERVRRGDSGSARAAGSAEEEEVYSALTSPSLSPLYSRARVTISPSLIFSACLFRFRTLDALCIRGGTGRSLRFACDALSLASISCCLPYPLYYTFIRVLYSTGAHHRRRTVLAILSSEL